MGYPGHFMRSAISLTILIALSATLRGESPAPSRRPRIGLALSGGAAYGLTHVGVIRWLEKNRIPVDAVAGTSMGALVGGLYAAGYSAAEIEQFLEKVDWKSVLAQTPDFQQLAYRRKEDQREYPTIFEFGLKKGIQFPSALSAGHGVGLVIARFAAPYYEMGTFDDLPTPFRCVATDLVKGREVVFDKGSLGQALRASMSLPAVFAPVKKDGMILVDGGLMNNIPVDLVKKMGVDIVIAVVLDKPPDPGKLNSLLALAGRSISVMISANERASIGMADLIVMPSLEGLEASDYLKWKEFIVRGEEASHKKKTMLERFALTEAEYAEFLRERERKRRPALVRPQIVEVNQDIAPRRRNALIASVSGDPSKPVDVPHVEEELTKLTGMGRFEAATYGFIRRGEATGLRVEAKEKEQGPPFLRVGLLLDASRQEGFRFGIGGRLYFLDLGGPASEWRTDLSIGVLNRASTEYYYRLRGGKWFIAPRFGFSEDSRPLYQNDEVISDFITRETDGSVDLGYAFGRFKEFRAGYTLGNHRIGVTKGLEAFDTLKGRYSDLHVRWVSEGQNSALVPTRGQRIAIGGAWVLDHPGVSRQYFTGEARYSYAKPFNETYSLLTHFAGGAGPNEEALNAQFTLGGVYRLDALARSQLLGSRFYYGGARVLRALGNDSLSLFGRFYLSAGYEFGNAWSKPATAKPRHSASAGLMGETIIGVVYFGGGIGDQGDARFFLRVGRVF